MTRIRLLSLWLFLFWLSTTLLFNWISMFIKFNYLFLKLISISFGQRDQKVLRSEIIPYQNGGGVLCHMLHAYDMHLPFSFVVFVSFVSVDCFRLPNLIFHFLVLLFVFDLFSFSVASNLFLLSLLDHLVFDHFQQNYLYHLENLLLLENFLQNLIRHFRF